MPPAELSVAQRVALALLTVYKVAFSPMFAGCVPVRSVVLGLRGRSGRTTRSRSRVLPGGTPAGALPSARRVRSGSGARRRRRDQITTINGKTGSSRSRPVLCRSVRLPGAVSAAKTAAQGRGRNGAPAGAPATPTPGPNAPAAQPEAVPQPAVAPAAAALVADSAERDIRFENESVTAVFTTRGGALKSWRLKKYQDAAREPLELIPANVPPGTVHPFTLSVPDAATSATLAQALFKPSATEVRVTSAPATLTFEYQDASGLTAHKEFVVRPDVSLRDRFFRDGDAGWTRRWCRRCSGVRRSAAGSWRARERYNPPPQPIFYRDGSVSRIADAKVAENAVAGRRLSVLPASTITTS